MLWISKIEGRPLGHIDLRDGLIMFTMLKC